MWRIPYSGIAKLIGHMPHVQIAAKKIPELAEAEELLKAEETLESASI